MCSEADVLSMGRTFRLTIGGGSETSRGIFKRLRFSMANDAPAGGVWSISSAVA